MPLVRAEHPDAEHGAVRAAVAAAWAVLREQAALDGVAAADADDAAVRRRLGLPVTPREAAGGGGDPVVATALRVVRAAARAYGG